MKTLAVSILAATAIVGHAPAWAADAAHGKELHAANCVSCHVNMTGGDGSVLYTRSDRKVNSLPQLEAQVRRCESNLELKWFDEDIADVVQYLNRTYYKFGG